MTLTHWLAVSYITVLLMALYVRLWTEGGFWLAVHTGRAFMLQAATLSFGIGFAYLEWAETLRILDQFIKRPIRPEVERLLSPPLEQLMKYPQLIFGLAVIFIFLYVISGFHERDYLTKVGNPLHAVKYISGISQEPTKKYKWFIIICLWLGTMCLVVAWYFLIARTGQGIWWYTRWFVLPVNVILIFCLTIGSWIVKRRRGTAGRPQQWDIESIPGKED